MNLELVCMTVTTKSGFCVDQVLNQSSSLVNFGLRLNILTISRRIRWIMILTRYKLLIKVSLTHIHTRQIVYDVDRENRDQCVYICVSVCLSLTLCACVRTYMHVCMRASVPDCMHTCLCVFVSVCVNCNGNYLESATTGCEINLFKYLVNNVSRIL